MFVGYLRAAIAASPRAALPAVAQALWRAVAECQVSEAEAEELSVLLDARQASGTGHRAGQSPNPRGTDASTLTDGRPRRVGSRPRSPASMERRRRWAASGGMPVALAARFTLAEQAVLAVVAGEVAVRGDCRLPVGAIAGMAGVSETTVRNAIREGRRLGLLHVEERRLDRWRSLPNIVRVVSAEWRQWIARGGRGGGCISARPPISPSRTSTVETDENQVRGYRAGAGRDRRVQNGPPVARAGRSGPSRGSPGR